MNNTSHLQPLTRSAFGIILNRQGQVLIGQDSGGRIAVPGGKFEAVDRCSSILALRREIMQEVGKKFRYRHIQALPKIFCTGAKVHTVVDAPTDADKFDLRFFYLLEALNEHVIENEPKEFKNPRFVGLSYLEDKVKGIDIRFAVGHAIELYRREGSLMNEPPRVTPEINYPEIRRTLRETGFDAKFAKIHSRVPTLPPEKARKLLPHVTSGIASSKAHPQV